MAEDAVKWRLRSGFRDQTLGDNIGDGPYQFVFHARPAAMKVVQRTSSWTISQLALMCAESGPQIGADNSQCIDGGERILYAGFKCSLV